MTDPELTRLRARMDELNERMLETLHERARLCREIGTHKRARGLPSTDLEREQAMLMAALANAPSHGFPPEQLTQVLAAVFAASRQLVADPER